MLSRHFPGRTRGWVALLHALRFRDCPSPKRSTEMPTLLPVTCHQGHHCSAHSTLAPRTPRPLKTFSAPVLTLSTALPLCQPRKVVAFSNHKRRTKPRHSGLKQTAVKGTHKRGHTRGSNAVPLLKGVTWASPATLDAPKQTSREDHTPGSPPCIRHHPRLSSSPGPCSSSNPFPPLELLQTSGEKAPPWLISAPTKGQH